MLRIRSRSSSGPSTSGSEGRQHARSDLVEPVGHGELHQELTRQTVEAVDDEHARLVALDPSESGRQAVSGVEPVRAGDSLVAEHVHEQKSLLLAVALNCSALDSQAVALRRLLVGRHSHVAERPFLRHLTGLSLH